MAEDDGTAHIEASCDYCGEPFLDDWYELTACLAAPSGEFPLPLGFGSPPTFCSERCAVRDLADRGFTIRRPDVDELSARAERAGDRWPVWLETLASLRTWPHGDGICLCCERKLPDRPYELLAFHPFTRHAIPDVLELAEPLRLCSPECGESELARHGLALA